MGSEMSFSVAFKGSQHTVQLPPHNSLSDLAALLAEQCGVAPETIKLLGGKAGMVRPAEHPERSLQEAGITAGAKLKMMASSGGDVAAVRAARDLPGLAPLDHELRRELARSAPPGASAAPAAPLRYTFHRFQAWRAPGLHPPPSEALKLLHRLACDPGIAGVMVRHRWEVGLLSEMPPEGLVGVSPMCILGVNKNKGQEISLRLRTDDLRGFRRYDRIVETMLHELAHMEHSEHDANFKALNSQLRREAAELDWRGSAAARSVAGIDAFGGRLDYNLPPAGPRGVMEQTAQLSGIRLRDLGSQGEGGPAGGVAAAATTPTLPPRAAVAQAALQRAAVTGGAPGGSSGGAVIPPQPPGQQQANQQQQEQRWRERVYRKGDLVWYRQRDGEWTPTQVVHVDHSLSPPSYGIELGGGRGSGSGSGGGAGAGVDGEEEQYRETEGPRLRPRQQGEVWPPGEEPPVVEGLGYRDSGTEEKEEEVRRRLEE